MATSSGTLHIYQPTRPGEDCWGLQFSGMHNGGATLAFSPDGSYLALGSGEMDARLGRAAGAVQRHAQWRGYTNLQP